MHSGGEVSICVAIEKSKSLRKSKIESIIFGPFPVRSTPVGKLELLKLQLQKRNVWNRPGLRLIFLLSHLRMRPSVKAPVQRQLFSTSLLGLMK